MATVAHPARLVIRQATVEEAVMVVIVVVEIVGAAVEMVGVEEAAAAAVVVIECFLAIRACYILPERLQ